MVTNMNYAIRCVMNDHDPAGLLYSGAPHDEYEVEISMIERFITNNKNKMNDEILADYIQIMMVTMFNDFMSILECFEMADEILDLIKKI